VSGTQRPYALPAVLDQGAPWAFVAQNNAQHCCIENARALILKWLYDVVVKKATRATGWYGFVETKLMPSGWLPTEAFAKQWASFVTQREHPVTLPP
jgi:hypothetical protein